MIFHYIFMPLYVWTSKNEVVKYSYIQAIVLLTEDAAPFQDRKPFDVGEIYFFCLKCHYDQIFALWFFDCNI